MSTIIPQTQLQTDIETYDVALDSFLRVINSSAITLNNFYSTLWTSLPDSRLSATLQTMYDNNTLYSTISSNQFAATTLNKVMSAWNYQGVQAITLSAGRGFYISGSTVILLSA